MSQPQGEYSKITWQDVTVEIGTLKPWGGNPKTSTKKDARALLKSWDELGQFQTIAIGPGGDVYDGHQRLSALLLVHGPEYQVAARQSSRPLTEQERRKIAIYSRQIGQWDWDTLSGWQPAELMEWGFDGDLLKDWKRDTAALDNFLKSEQAAPVDAEPQIDRATELNEKWKVCAGDLWQIGTHRLLCGDSTKREDVERVMGGEKARMVFTDPPYALFGNSTGVSSVTDDKMTAPFFREVFKRAKEFTEEFSHIYVCCDWHSAFALRQSGIETGLSEKNLIVWDKGDGGVGAMYQQCYELIWFFANSPAYSGVSGKKKAGERTVNGVPNIWRFPRMDANREHNAQKPVELVEVGVKNGCSSGELVLELFSGSGTTLVACQNLGRVCRAVEISESYCAVILERMATAFPELEIKRL